MLLTSEQTRQLTEENHLLTYKRYPVTLVRGRGAKVWDSDGREYIDALAGIGVNSVGHSHPKVVGAITRQAEELIHISNLYYNRPQALLAEKLTRLSGLDRAFFCNSGAEANEAAIKIARKAGSLKGKTGTIVSMENCFHGRTIGTIAMGKEKYSKGFGPMPEGFERVPFNDPEALERIVNDQTVAVIIEPVQGEGGVHPASEEFLQKARAVCDRHDALLIFDEIQCGIARTGEMFAWEHYGVKPDILTLAKGLGGGVPIGAVLLSEQAASAMGYGEHGTTFGGNPLACAAALATLEVIEEEKLDEKARTEGEYIMQTLRERTRGWEVIRTIRGIGLMIGVELNMKGADVVNRMLEKGVLSNCASDTVMRLLPPLVISREETDRVIDVLLESIRESEAAAGSPEAGGNGAK